MGNYCLTLRRCAALMFLAAFFTISALAQGSSFTYQGKLTDNGAAANGTYEMQFRLLDNQSNQVGATFTLNNVVVTSGIFTARLTFGLLAFDGNPRFLEVGVRPLGSSNPFTILNPPQSFLSMPYAIRSVSAGTADLATNAINSENAAFAGHASNSSQLGGIAANQYVLTGDARLSDARNPLPGSGNYVQNSTTLQSANFTITGTGFANIFNAGTQFNIGAQRVLSTPGNSNIFAGVNSGNNNNGTGNAFFGGQSGQSNLSGINNSFFGFNAGSANNGGGANTFIGVNAGIANIGSSNNSFFGANAGNSNLTGNGNTYLGANSDGSFLITNSVAIGQKAYVGQSNALILGSINGVNTATADTDVGIGTSTPASRLHVLNNTDTSVLVESNATRGAGIELKSNRQQTHNWVIYTGDPDNFGYNMHFYDKTTNSIPMSLRGEAATGHGSVRIYGLLADTIFISNDPPQDGDAPICRNSFSGRIVRCDSSKLQGFVSTALADSVKKQQLQIEQQQKQIEELKAIVCTLKPDASACSKPIEK